MKKNIGIFLFCAFLCSMVGCATTSTGNPDPVKSIKQWDQWIQENLW